MSLTTKFWPIVPAGNGWLYSGTIPTPVWSAIPNYLNQTVSLSVNITNLFVAPTAGTTLALTTGTLPTGWSFADPVLSYSGSGVGGPNTIGFTATNTGLSTVGPLFSIQGVAGLGADTSPPTVPTGLVATSVIANQVVLAWNPSSDANPSGYLWNGMAQYNVKRTPPGSVIGTVASAVGNQPILILNDVGSPSPVSTFAQTGPDCAMTSYGNNIFGTADQFAFVAQQLTGTSWVMSCKISSWASAQAFAKAGLMARKSLAANSAYVNTVCFPFSQGHGFAQESRATDGASAVQGAAISNSASPVWLFLFRSGDTYTSYYSLDGNTVVSLGSVTQVMGSTIYVGPSLSSNQTGLQVSVTFQQVNIQTLSAPNYTDNTVAAGTAYTYAISAQDPVPNVSAYSTGLAVTTPSSTYSPDFPRLGSYLIGGTQNYDDAYAQWAALMNVNIINGNYTGGGAGMYNGSRANLVNRISALSPAVVSSKTFQYYISDNINQISPTVAAIKTHVDATTNWYAWTNGLTKATHALNPFGGHGWWMINNAPNGGVDSGGLYLEEYWAKYYNDNFINGATSDAAPNMAGLYRDNGVLKPEVACDYNLDGTSEATTNAAFILAQKQGQAKGGLYIKANTSKIIIGNIAGWGFSSSFGGTDVTGVDQVYQGGVAESSLGLTSSPETWGGYSTLKAGYQFAMLHTASPYLVLIHHDQLSATGTDATTATAYQAARYGLCLTLMDNGYYNTSQSGAYNFTQRNYFDEFSADYTTGVCPTFDGTAASVGSKRGFLGQRTNAPWSSIVVGGKTVYFATFHNSTNGKDWIVISNAKGNGSLSFPVGTAVPGKQFKALTGAQAPTINNGATVSNVAMLDRDGRIGQLV